jgi:acyl-CoA synthetase (AMP-forming)/AMP-acid ligase II
MLSVLMPPSAFIRRPLTWLRAFDKYRGTHGYSPNFGYDLCVTRTTEEQRAELDLSCVRTFFNGAEPVRRRTRDRFVEAFAVSKLAPEAHTPGYGLAEATVIVSIRTDNRTSGGLLVDAAALERHEVVLRDAPVEGMTRELVCDGVVGDGYDARIVDPVTLEELPPARVGELWVAGPSVCPGYWLREAETEAAFRAHLASGEGPFLRTGDLAFMHDGEVVICGRARDLIVIHGRNVYPQDIELTAELAHPAIHAGGSAAFSVDDGTSESLVLVVEVTGDPDEGAVRSAIIAAVMREFELHVKDVLLVAPFTIPKTSSGKKQRSATRRLWQEARDTDVQPAAP